MTELTEEQIQANKNAEKQRIAKLQAKRQRVLNDLGPEDGPVRRAAGMLVSLDDSTLQRVLDVVAECRKIA